MAHTTLREGPRSQHHRRFGESYRAGEHGRFVLDAAAIGSLGATALLIEQPAGRYTTHGTEDLVLCSLAGQGVGADIDFGAGGFRFDSAATPFFLSPAGAPSAFAVEHDHIAQVLAVPMHEVRELLGRHGMRAQEELEPLFARGFADPFLAGVLAQIDEARAFPGASGLLLLDSLLVTAILALQRIGGSARGGRPLLSGGLSPAAVRRATEFLMAGLDEPAGLKALAAHCGMSEFHFQRAFTRTVGCSPHRWQFLRRMERACELLRQPGHSVTDVALAVGYESPQSFARVFRRHYGCTPQGYRRALS
ncbi:helix-turn-helix transcriptional regulator [Erythrobacter sp. NE805]|uniref:helix-turn-helix transcriptional regulator n=1 Tax=Erythrobacter sp. NE805 TaxID=3389875 RepID=UPI00396B3AF6